LRGSAVTLTTVRC